MNEYIAGMAALDGFIYVITSRGSFYKFSPVVNSWVTMASFPVRPDGREAPAPAISVETIQQAVQAANSWSRPTYIQMPPQPEPVEPEPSQPGRRRMKV